MKAIGYVRVSTSGQAIDGVSLESQRERINAWCVAHGADLQSVYVEVQSGKRADNRPELQRALDHAAKESCRLVVYSLSRLARSTADAIRIADRLDKSGADLVSLSEDINTGSAAGRMIFRLLASLAEFERELVAERTRDALQHKRTKQERVGKVPFGFVLATDGVNLVEDDQEQRILALIEELHVKGMSLRAIARELTDRNIPTKEGKPVWNHTSVRRIVNRIAA